MQKSEGIYIKNKCEYYDERFLNRAAMISRIDNAVKHDIQIVNCGVLTGYVQGILEGALEPFSLTKAIDDGDCI